MSRPRMRVALLIGLGSLLISGCATFRDLSPETRAQEITCNR